jgi:hypothetical protein
MKIRTGFVSNSSSASFVVQWRCRVDNEKTLSVTEAVSLLLFDDLSLTDESGWPRTPQYADESRDNWNEFKIAKELIEKTKHLHDNVYETLFRTSMRNDVTSYGPAAGALMLALTEAYATRGEASTCSLVFARAEGDSI